MNTYDIEIGKMNVTNFMSIGPTVEFDFSGRNKMNFVYGENKDVPGERNGCGKTVIFGEALLFAMFGETCREIKNEYIAHRQMPKGTQVRVDLKLKIKEQQYEIESGMDMPYCNTFFRLYKILEDGSKESLSRASIKETRLYFEKEIIKTNCETFKNSVILSATDSSNFFKLKKSDKREFAEAMFNLIIFGKMLICVRKDANALDKEIVSTRNMLINLRDNEIQYNDHLKNHETERTEYKKNLEVKLTETKASLERANIIHNEYEIKHKEYSEIKTSFEGIESLRTKLDAALSISNNDILHYTELMNKHKEILDIVCDDCKLNVKREKVDIHEEGLKKAQDNIKKCNEGLEALKKKEEELFKIAKNSFDAKVKADQAYRQIRTSIETISNINNSIKNLEKQISTTEEIASPFKKLLEECQEKIKMEDSKLLGFIENRKNLEAMEQVVSDEGAKKFIVKDLVNIQNSMIRKYLDEMGGMYTCVFDGSFNCEFLTDSGPCMYYNFSFGETSRIDISVLLAFRDVLLNLGSLRCNVLILDEFMDNGLDTYGVNSLVKILKNSIVKECQSVYLISHRECFSEEDFDSFIEVQKRGGFTYLRAIS